MRQSGHWKRGGGLNPDDFQSLIAEVIDRLDVEQARREVLPFARNPEALALWSREFFLDAGRLRMRAPYEALIEYDEISDRHSEISMIKSCP